MNLVKVCEYLKTKKNLCFMSTLDSSKKILNNLIHELLQILSYLPDIIFLSETKIKMSLLTIANLTGY